MDKLVPAFETTLFDPTLSDACSDMAELGIDSLLDDGVFKSIPVPLEVKLNAIFKQTLLVSFIASLVCHNKKNLTDIQFFTSENQ